MRVIHLHAMAMAMTMVYSCSIRWCWEGKRKKHFPSPLSLSALLVRLTSTVENPYIKNYLKYTSTKFSYHTIQ